MKTMVMGASPKPHRISYRVTLILSEGGHEVVPIGINKGNIGSLEIKELESKPSIEDIHTISMYIGPANQRSWYQYILDLKPKRVIFNPGSENPEIYEKLTLAGIAFEESCTLVLLSTGSYFY